MIKRIKLNRHAIAAATLLFASMHAMTQNPKDIMRRMEDNMRGTTSFSEMTMETVRPRFTRQITMKSWTMGDDYALILVTAPARDKGTVFLKRENEIWNFVPTIDRTIKMPPSMMSQSWMGSDFTNDDLVQGSSTVDDFEHKLLGKEIVGGIECYKIEMRPLPETPIVFDRVVRWVSTGTYLPVKVENYDEFGELVSSILFREVRNMDGRNIPSVMEIIPHDKPGHRTIITIHTSDFGISLNQAFFSQQNMRNVR